VTGNVLIGYSVDVLLVQRPEAAAESS
jgi:hypothetical protein